MRIGIVSVLALALCALAAAPASAGSKLSACDAISAPGGTLTTTVELTNPGDRPARFKVSVQVHGDRDNVAGPRGKVRGKKTKQTFTVAPGGKVEQDMACGVPGGALGPMVVTVTVNGPDGRQNYEAGSWAFPDGEMPDPSDPPQDWSEPEILELTGTVTLTEDWFPSPYQGKPDGSDSGPMPGDDWMPPPFESGLLFTSDDGDEWQLVGPEAFVLAALMWKAEVFEAEAAVKGFPLEAIPIFFGEEDGLTRKSGKNGGGNYPPAMNALFLLEWQSDDIEDPRPKLVEFRWILDGDRSKVEEWAEYIVQDEDEWETMLADAGIIFPDPSAIDDWYFPMTGVDPSGRENGGELPPDWMPPDSWYPWEVDFENETVIGLFVGERSTTGYWVQIDRIVRDDEKGLVVEYYVTEPDPWMVVLDVVTYPFTIIAIPKTDEEISFVEVDAPTWYYDVPQNGTFSYSK